MRSIDQVGLFCLLSRLAAGNKPKRSQKSALLTLQKTNADWPSPVAFALLLCVEFSPALKIVSPTSGQVIDAASGFDVLWETEPNDPERLGLALTQSASSYFFGAVSVSASSFRIGSYPASLYYGKDAQLDFAATNYQSVTITSTFAHVGPFTLTASAPTLSRSSTSTDSSSSSLSPLTETTTTTMTTMATQASSPSQIPATVTDGYSRGSSNPPPTTTSTDIGSPSETTQTTSDSNPHTSIGAHASAATAVSEQSNASPSSSRVAAKTGLSTGARAGLGAGVAVAGTILLLLCGVLFFNRCGGRRHRYKRSRILSSPPFDPDPWEEEQASSESKCLQNDPAQTPSQNGIEEAQSSYKAFHELDVDLHEKVAELPASSQESCRYELPE